MKPLLRSLLPLLTLFVLAVSCCDDEDEPPLVCGVEDPINDLQWLKDKVAELEASSIGEYTFIVQAELSGSPVFIVNNCCPFCNTALLVYECNGYQLEFANPDLASFKNQKVIWKPDDSVCMFN